MKKLILSLLLLSGVAHAQTTPTISTTDVTTSGFNASNALQNAATSMYFQNDGETLLVVKGGASSVTATVKTQATTMSQNGYGSVALTDQTVSVPAGAVVVAGPFPTGRWNNQYGLVGVSMSAVTGVSASTLRVPE